MAKFRPPTSASASESVKSEAPAEARQSLDLDRVEWAFLHLLRVGAASAVVDPTSPDRHARVLLAGVVRLVEAHHQHMLDQVLKEDAAAIVPMVALIYEKVRAGELNETDPQYERLMVFAFEERKQSLSSTQIETLKLSKEGIMGCNKGGPVEAARQKVGEVLGISGRTIRNEAKREAPFGLRFSQPRIAFGQSIGDPGVIRWVFRLLGWSAEGPDNEERLRGWREEEVRGILTLLRANKNRIEELLERRRSLRRPPSPGDP